MLLPACNLFPVQEPPAAGRPVVSNCSGCQWRGCKNSMAILFEMGLAFELAGNRESWLKSYMEVYARNIDYRNVAERIRNLEGSS